MIGIIGGAGPLASALLYQLVVEECYQQKPITIPEMLILNHSFPRGLTREESKSNKKLLEDELETCIQLLLQAGASVICIACNTLHSFLKKPVGRNIIHLPSRVISSVREHDVKRVGVLATQTTKSANLYADDAISACFPNKEEQFSLDSVIDRVLEGKILPEDGVCIEKIIENLHRRHGISGIILGCTDLSLLNHRYPLKTEGVLVFDSIKIAAKDLVKTIHM